jgi:hypothetical protein
MKQSNRTSSGTSFHGHTIKATYNELVKTIGFPTDRGDGGYKSHFGWTLEDSTGNVFTVYDWKTDLQGPDTAINWHIGAMNQEVSKTGADLVNEALYKLR